ncbi:hypothetical protein ALC62_15263 [Cyphomyrmex costatus]|uniref:Uncharacterized protein n=1 Tax=Cyphomyrmex costatus TaxID=456900 RepID=A0A151I7L2_9HYME|nr:hypothetical protein ALC62_15263 [Cyphomyrmex costatus]
MSNEERPYYIVEFSDGIQLIPHNWFNSSKNKAYWPNFINITKYNKAIKNMQPVGEDWNLYDVIKIFGSAQSFESGKKKLKLAETISDLNTDFSDEEKSKKERRKKAAKKFDTDSDTDSDSSAIIESLLEPFPIINAHKAKTVNTIIDSKFESLQKIDNQAASTSFQSNYDILPSEFSITSKKQKRDEISALNSKNKKMKKNNIEKDFEVDKENLQPCISTGTCICIIICTI